MQLGGLVASAGINIGTAILFLTLYSMFRKRPGNVNVYFARHVLRDRDVLKSPRFALESLVPSIGWIRMALQPGEDEIIADSGLDAAIFLRMFVFSIRFFCICTFFGFGILAPINYTDDLLPHESKKGLFYDQLDLFSISNVQYGSNRLWAHLCVLYIISLAAYLLLYMEYEHVCEKRLEYLRKVRPQPDQFTVLVRSIPHKQNDPRSYSEILKEFFMRYYPSTYFTHQMTFDEWKIQDGKKRLDKLMKKIDNKRGKPATNGLSLSCWKGSTVEDLTKEYEELYWEIQREQRKLLMSAADKELPIAFVSFKSRWGATLAAQTQLSVDATAWITEWAPEPRDIYWPNLAMPCALQRLYAVGVWTAVFIIIILYFVPVGLVQTLAQLDNLRRWFPAMNLLLKVPGLNQVITGYLPSLLLSLLLYFIPSVMLFLSKIEGKVSISSQEGEACKKVFYFLVGNVFFISVLSGSLLDQLNELISNPKDLPNQLAIAVPRQATFFITYILTSGYAGFPLEILMLADILLNFIRRNIMGRTKFDPATVYSLQYYRAMPYVQLFVLLGLMYAVLAPLLLPFLLVYFIFGYIIYRNQIIHVYQPAYETCGQFWPQMHNGVILALMLMQIMFIGVFGVKSKPTASVLTIPLPIITLLFNDYCNHKFLPNFGRLSVQVTMDKDMDDERMGLKEGTLQVLESAYVHPALQPLQQTDNEAGECTQPMLLKSEEDS